jgi:hypothetical protein
LLANNTCVCPPGRVFDTFGSCGCNDAYCAFCDENTGECT